MALLTRVLAVHLVSTGAQREERRDGPGPFASSRRYGVVDSPVESLGSVRNAAEVLVFRPILPLPKLQ